MQILLVWLLATHVKTVGEGSLDRIGTLVQVLEPGSPYYGRKGHISGTGFDGKLEVNFGPVLAGIEVIKLLTK